ncbi:MAG: TRAP transporter large permease [Bacteroidales bacterium]|nr:TRAP transporter large permease [Bacteroidales bacterium]MBN2818673.1 TRAP transporter large permease [Bacteroidales bacterium]
MDYLGVIILVISFIILLTLGVPIAYSIGISGILTMLVSIDTLPAFTTFAHRMATGLDSFALLAIPFFILAGNIMNSGGIAIRLINLARIVVGRWPAGLAVVNVFANMLFGAISGSAAASASAIGSIMGPEMKKEGYNENFSAAVNISSATTGLSIPPSNILIVYSLASGGVSITALFLAGYVPGIITGISIMLMAMSMMVYKNKGFKGVIITLLKFVIGTLALIGIGIGIKASGNHSDLLKYILYGFLILVFAAYVVYRSRKSDNHGNHAFKTLWDAIPSLLLLVVVIGGIVAGFFTATEASAVAVLYAFILAVIYKEISLKDMPIIILRSVKTTSIVMLLVATCMGLSWIMAYENIPQTVSEGLLSISDNPVIILLIINFILLFVGVFMDMTPAVLIFTPIFLPIVSGIGIDPVHFGIIMVLNLSVGLCTPPVGAVLFIGCSVSGVKIEKVIKPLLPMFVVMIISLLLVTYFPVLSLWLPSAFGF